MDQPSRQVPKKIKWSIYHVEISNGFWRIKELEKLLNW
jgi:hypothetical protein